jgi:hypothetical protein
VGWGVFDGQEQTRTKSKKKSNGEKNDGWTDPQPLGGELPPVAGFDLALMPAALRPLVEDTAERMQVPCDFAAVVAVLCIAGVTGRRARVQPKAEDTS